LEVKVNRFGYVLALSVVFMTAAISSAEIPQVVNYQGKVTDTGGAPVPNGTYQMRFRIYDAASVGNLEWDSGNRSIQVTGGVFDVLLGESPQPTVDLSFDEDYWLLVTIAGDDQTPRQPLGSTGYAYMASGLVPGTEVMGTVTSGTHSAIKGTNTASFGTTYGLYGLSSSSEGIGVYGRVSHTSGTTFGGRFETSSELGIGVFGRAASTDGFAYGVWGASSATSGRGVFGSASSTVGEAYGIYGECVSTEGKAVYCDASASTGTTYGLYAKSASTAGTGVRGVVTALTGTTHGGSFQTSSTAGYGVYGLANATTGQNHGVAGQTNSINGRAVYGHAVAATGECYGGRFENGSSSGRGVFGHAYSGSGTTYGVHGRSDSSAGYGVYYSGGLAGTGTKSCVVKTSQGPTLFYCQESPESWFEDFGEANLSNGRVHIELDPFFLEAVTIGSDSPMKVFVELGGDCRGVYVERGKTGFDVIELQGGMSSVPFAYRVVAKRKGFEARRLDVCEAARTDPYLYPQLREKEMRELERDRAQMDERARRIREARVQVTKELEAGSRVPKIGDLNVY